ncbi:MAG: flagellar hook protein FlgE [Gammaproteobacteria bacterium]|nr:flagellar hook protein FlgE [Gammaproteobacteria bacterium]MDH3450316.1 flagellar hook protein FlgE [Gammaproteobacteria bacterium]
MSFNTALSGLQAASVDLSVTSNNIANVSTTGFKHSRAEFGDLFEISPFGNTPTSVGSGVQVTSVSQQFDQGNLKFTNASLDMAISGQGFFITNKDLTGADISYTRAGQFGIDKDGYISNSSGEYVQAFPVDANGNVTSTSLNTTVPVQLPASTGAPQATTEIEVGLNFDAASLALDPAGFDPTASNTYTHSTSTTIFDSLGASHVLSYYFIHDLPGSATNPGSDPNQWAVFTYLDGAEVDIAGGATVAHLNGGLPVNQDAGLINFNPDGSYASSTPAALQNTAVALTNGANPLTVIHDFANNSTTQYAASFSVSTLDPDGYSTGRLTGLDISEDGLMRATYSNGISVPLGQIALADFPNSQGLRAIGDSSWLETIDSGAVITGSAGTGRFGLIQAGALESSNVDLTQQLVNLITAQRNFQANARSIETSNAITDTVIQIR